MNDVILKKADVRDWIECVVREHTTWAPVEQGEMYRFEKVNSADRVALDYQTTILPLRKIFFPPHETLVRYKRGETVEVEPVLEAGDAVVLGVHPCDLHGLMLLDRLMYDDLIDQHYRLRRERAIIVGVSCMPDEYCFCHSMGTDTASEGFDLGMVDLGDRYFVEVATERGARLLDATPTAPATGDDIRAYREYHLKRTRLFTAKVEADASHLPLLFTWAYDSKLWKELGRKCVSCGACNLVCPTCCCFDVHDADDLSGTTGVRERRWDGCQLPGYAAVAGGENFRESIESRNRHRFYRKFHYLMDSYERPYCVGCGRCGRACPAGITIHENLNALMLPEYRGTEYARR
jgi:sulfhydrogenase subunit beta (sulfur reductase)